MVNENYQSGYIFEFVYINDIVKVSVVCPNTKLEVSFQAPINTHRMSLERLGMQKMQYLKNKLQRH